MVAHFDRSFDGGRTNPILFSFLRLRALIAIFLNNLEQEGLLIQRLITSITIWCVKIISKTLEQRKSENWFKISTDN